MALISMTVNGVQVSQEVDDSTLLIEFLREKLKLTGTHMGCDTTQCGCCVVHIDGVSAKSCTVLVGQAAGRSVTTIEGLAKGGELHPLQKAFREHHALQCGFCTPGQIMAGAELIATYPGELNEHVVREEMEGNLCRCTGYHNIVRAILAAGAEIRGTKITDPTLASHSVEG
ncbi:(2Fe-2S)-binding protein [Caulobacter sp. S45]|jgi:carbon-monoxide dehydrogenase small subunit|uniref:(2Fe-2S)-binding protein n=1 Tax=Caulobacter sp. S45 TaxID=1641861 RepID=UPI00131BEE8E|nr:(2Fe-2S)-binding protein [Caulobacter sp. S45]